MSEKPNVFADTFSFERLSVRGEPVARKAGAELLGGTLYELPPGADGMPLHIHHAMEELLVVLEGTPTLRTLDGDRDLARGEVVAFPRGRRGAHTVANRSDSAARYLMMSTKTTPEIVEYPELGTVRVVTRSPFDPPGPDDDPADHIRLLFDRSAAKDETPPR
jgi:uncharacterized cupin superfamily protein